MIMVNPPPHKTGNIPGTVGKCGVEYGVQNIHPDILSGGVMIR